MDPEISARFAVQEERIAELARQLEAVLNPPPPSKVLMLKQVAPDLGISIETLRRRILRDPAWQKQGGRWVKRA